MDKIYFCIMKRLGNRLFRYGEDTDDYTLETLIRTSPDVADLVKCIDSRQLNHECDTCKDFTLCLNVKKAGEIGDVRFV